MSDKRKLVKSVATGTVCGLLTGVILLCILAVVILKGGLLSAQVIDYFTAGLLGAGALTGGFVATKLNRGAGLIAGAATGGCMLLLVILAAALRGKADVSALLFIKLGAALAGGALGGILALKEKKHRGL